MSKEFNRILSERDKGVRESGNPLTHLFRQILETYNIGPDLWNNRLTRYLRSGLSRTPKNAKDIGQERNNFNRALARSHMTWKTFQKAIQVLGPISYRIDITMTFRSGRSTTHSVTVANPLAKLDEIGNKTPGYELDPTFGDGQYDDEPDQCQDDLDTKPDSMQ